MPGSINEVYLVAFPRHPYWCELYSDSSLLLYLHRVEHLSVFHFAFFLGPCEFEHQGILWYYSCMKKILLILFLFSGIVFALTDTDADGISDDVDICPRVYARSATGCPTLAPVIVAPALNSCLTAQLKNGRIIATIRPICDAETKICPRVKNIF